MDRHQTGVYMRVVADRLMNFDPETFTCCGIPLDGSGRCQNRDEHATPFNPYSLEPMPNPKGKVACDCLETGRIWCCMPDSHYQGETREN